MFFAIASHHAVTKASTARGFGILPATCNVYRPIASSTQSLACYDPRVWRLLFPIAMALSVAQGQAGLTPEARQEILDYKLTMQRANQLIAALPEMSTFVLSLSPEERAKAAKATPAERIANTANNPTSAAILKRNGLTAAEYLVGVPALRMAMMVAQGLPATNGIVASPVNVAFVKANLAALKPKWDAANGLGGPVK
jgi:hypothetical protein